MRTWILIWSLIGVAQAGTVEVGPWCGSVTTTSAVVKARVTGDVLLELTGREPVRPAISADGLATYRLDRLEPNTTYHYRLGDRDAQFRTFPTGQASFRFAFGSCGSGANHPVYQAIADTDPLFYLNLGDLHYANIAVNDPAKYYRALESVFSQPHHAALLRRIPLVYVWDDHDYGPNDSDRTSPSRAAAHRAYREMIPHYPLPSPEAISQTFDVGRVKFLLTDLRSDRTPNRAADDAAKSMFGAVQKEWFQRELLAAKDRYPVIFWVSSVTWIGKPAPADHWSGFATERRELANFLKRHNIRNVVMLTGDAHCTAADDGSHADYADGGGAPLRVLMSSPLDRPGNSKGGPYSHGPYSPGTGEGLFALVSVEDRGDAVTVTFSGRNHRNEERLRYEFNVPGR